MTLPKEYIEFVLTVYDHSVAENAISLLLSNPSPANLRDACWARYQRGSLPKDERMLRDFFGHAADPKALEEQIKNWPIDRFRTLNRFLKTRSGNPSAVNIELMAWLVDAPHRPYHSSTGYKQLKTAFEKGLQTPPVDLLVSTVKEEAEEKEINMPEALDAEEKKNEKPFPEERREAMGIAGGSGNLKKDASYNKRTIQVIIALLLVCLGFVAYKLVVPPKEFCMYWSGDHFERISCNQQTTGRLAVAFDAVRYHNFKKITREDTLTYAAIGHVWYSKKDNRLEYFTADGQHPVRVNDKLKPITAYIIDTYIRQATQVGQAKP